MKGADISKRNTLVKRYNAARSKKTKAMRMAELMDFEARFL